MSEVLPHTVQRLSSPNRVTEQSTCFFIVAAAHAAMSKGLRAITSPGE